MIRMAVISGQSTLVTKLLHQISRYITFLGDSDWQCSLWSYYYWQYIQPTVTLLSYAHQVRTLLLYVRFQRLPDNWNFLNAKKSMYRIQWIDVSLHFLRQQILHRTSVNLLPIDNTFHTLSSGEPGVMVATAFYNSSFRAHCSHYSDRKPFRRLLRPLELMVTATLHEGDRRTLFCGPVFLVNSGTRLNVLRRATQSIVYCNNFLFQ